MEKPHSVVKGARDGREHVVKDEAADHSEKARVSRGLRLVDMTWDNARISTSTLIRQYIPTVKQIPDLGFKPAYQVGLWLPSVSLLCRIKQVLSLKGITRAFKQTRFLC
jgi:hypothetical protein